MMVYANNGGYIGCNRAPYCGFELLGYPFARSRRVLLFYSPVGYLLSVFLCFSCFVL